MSKKLLNIIFIFTALVALSNGATKCTEGKDGLMVMLIIINFIKFL